MGEKLKQVKELQKLSREHREMNPELSSVLWEAGCLIDDLYTKYKESSRLAADYYKVIVSLRKELGENG